MISGVQVDAWSAFVPGQGKVIEKLREGVVKAVEARGLPNLEITTGEMAISDSMFGGLIGEKREYTFFQQKFGNSEFLQKYGASANATLALRIAPRGNEDLEISWRLLESNPAKSLFLGLSQTALVYVGGIVALAGLTLTPFGMGFCVLPFGIWMMGIGLGWWKGTSQKSRLTTDQMLDSRVLGQTVDFCLMTELDKLGIASSDLRILQAAQMEGIGSLGKK